MSNYTIPNTFIPYSPADANKINANFTAIETLLNSTGLDQAGLGSDSVITAKIVDAAVTTSKFGDQSITTAKIAAANITNAKYSSTAALGAAGGATGVGTTLVLAGSVTLTSTGRPALVKIQPDGGATASSMGAFVNSLVTTTTQSSGILHLYRDSTLIAKWTVKITVATSHNAVELTNNMSFLDVNSTSGAHTYSLYLSSPDILNACSDDFIKLVAIEL